MTDWSRLLHAYGPATDTPGHLRALLGRRRRALGRAESHLDMAVLHQGFVYPATGPAAEWIAARLREDAFAAAPDLRDGPLIAILLRFLAEAARSALSAPEHSPPRPPEESVRALQAALRRPYDRDVVWSDELLAARTWAAIDGMRAAARPIYDAARTT